MSRLWSVREGEAWLDNPPRRKSRRKRAKSSRRRARRSRRRNPIGFSTLFNPPKRHRRRRAKSYRKHRRSFRRNPGLGAALPGPRMITQGISAKDVAALALGGVGGEWIGAAIQANSPVGQAFLQTPAGAIVTRILGGAGAALIAKKILGGEAGKMAMAGALAPVVVQTAKAVLPLPSPAALGLYTPLGLGIYAPVPTEAPVGAGFGGESLPAGSAY